MKLLLDTHVLLPAAGSTDGSSDEAAAVSRLPDIHKDPFDRILVAQALVEGVTLLTADARVCDYGGPVRKV